MRRACLLLVLAACPPPGRNGPPPPPPPGAGCPAGNAIFVASYLTPSDKGGHTGWVLPLLDKPVDTIENLPEFTPLDAAAATALGLTPPAATPWLYAPNAQPCKAALGGFYSAPVDATAPNLTYGVELTGCPVPADPQNTEAIVLAQDATPTECRLEAPQPIAARLGESDAQKHWTRPTKATPIPPELAAVIPAHACTAPACEMLWSFGHVASANVWAGAVDWLATADDKPQCEWTDETFTGFFIAGPDGKPVKITEGQEHPLALTSVLVDRGGPRALIAQGVGEYAIYDLANHAATLARHLVWLRANAEAYGQDDHLGPECGE